MTAVETDGRRVAAKKRSNTEREALTLKDLRLRLDLPMSVVEARTGVRRAAISEIERHLRLPRLHELRALAECYGVDADRFEVVVEYRLPVEEGS
jgi:transcriptional regulator with XRE-family HTH domain